MKGRLSILIAEDKEDDRRILELCVRRSGRLVDVKTARNGVELLEQMAKEGAGPYDIILMDLNMPVKDGREALRNLRDQKDLTPVVVLTTSTDPADIQQAYSSGANAYFIKPYDIQDFQDLLSRVIDHWAASTLPPRAKPLEGEISEP